jgi:hypothetical protein
MKTKTIIFFLLWGGLYLVISLSTSCFAWGILIVSFCIPGFIYGILCLLDVLSKISGSSLELILTNKKITWATIIGSALMILGFAITQINKGDSLYALGGITAIVGAMFILAVVIHFLSMIPAWVRWAIAIASLLCGVIHWHN